jgi:hypothetical protein
MNIINLIVARLSIVLHMAGGSGGGPKKKKLKKHRIKSQKLNK